MANVLKIKKNSTWDSTSNPSNSDVVYGELAWANGTKRLYIGRQSTSGGAVTATRIGGEVGLANDQIVKLDEACSSGEVAVFGSTGLTGRTVTEFKSDLVLGTTSAANFASVTTTGDNTVGANLAVTGNITVTGNLQVNGTTTTINSTTMTVDDKDLVLGSVASPSDTTANDGGIILKGANDKKLTYSSTGDKWVFNKALDVGGSVDVTGNIVVSGTVDGRDVATDGTKLDWIASSANNFAMTVSHNAGTAAAFASGSTLNITGSSGITVNRTNSSYTFSIDTSSVCTLDATQILTNKTIDGGTF